jgi:hypothetical protein
LARAFDFGAEFRYRLTPLTRSRSDAKDVEEVVRAAVAGEQPLEIIGHGKKRAIGHPTATNAVLDPATAQGLTIGMPNGVGADPFSPPNSPPSAQWSRANVLPTPTLSTAFSRVG